MPGAAHSSRRYGRSEWETRRFRCHLYLPIWVHPFWQPRKFNLRLWQTIWIVGCFSILFFFFGFRSYLVDWEANGLEKHRLVSTLIVVLRQSLTMVSTAFLTILRHSEASSNIRALTIFGWRVKKNRFAPEKENGRPTHHLANVSRTFSIFSDYLYLVSSVLPPPPLFSIIPLFSFTWTSNNWFLSALITVFLAYLFFFLFFPSYIFIFWMFLSSNLFLAIFIFFFFR